MFPLMPVDVKTSFNHVLGVMKLVALQSNIALL